MMFKPLSGIRVYRDKTTLSNLGIGRVALIVIVAVITPFRCSVAKAKLTVTLSQVLRKVMERMDSPALYATSCAMHTADGSNHSAAGTLHPHRSTTCFLYVWPT